MKVSINNLRFYQQLYKWAGDPAPDGVDKLVERIGAQLAAVEETISVGDKYAGVVVARVVDCRKHENSDHLSVCNIDDGGVTVDVKRDDNGYVQVVCGAPNVRAGLSVAWLPPGSTVPNSYDTEPFVLSVREIRGEVSNGMLASASELAIGDGHDGILEIDDDVAPGTMFADQYGLAGDAVIDMENKMFTHRPDCFGMIGVAREIAGIQGQKFTSPDWYRADATIEAPVEVPASAQLRVEVRNEIPGLVPRFVAVPMSGVTIKPSPVWLQVELSRLGLRPINNIVDLTNYHMLSTGQPMHAYDYDKVVAQDTQNDQAADHATLVVRHPHKNEKLALLNGKAIEPRAEAIMIATATKSIGLGGVMGGADTEVDDSTTNIILECASFDMYSIRRTAMAHGVFTDAVTRFNKGQSPLQNMAVLGHIVSDIKRIVGASVAGPVVDDNHLASDVTERGSIHPDVTVTAQFITERLGLKLSAEEMAALLTNVEFKVSVQDDTLTVRAPFWRTDIEIPEDVVEEVGRLYGFDKLPLDPPRRDLTPARKDAAFELKARVRDTLTRAGANEVLTYSFVDGNLLDKSAQNKDIAFKLSNALSPDLQYYRLSLTPSLLDKVHANIKAGYDEFALFEIGKAHATTEMDEDGLPMESDRLACVFAVDAKKAARSYSGAAYYQARKYLQTLFSGDNLPYTLVSLGDVSHEGNVLLEQMAAPFDPARSAAVYDGEHVVGVVGEYKLSTQKALKLPKFSAGFELLLSALESVQSANYVTQSRFPKVWQDISLRVAAGLKYQELHDFVWQNLQSQQPASTTMSLAPLDIYQRPDDTDHKQITLRLTIASYDKTMTDTEVAGMLNDVAVAAASALSAERL